MTTLFISDLHLSDERADLCQAFTTFCTTRARQCERLFILGDLVDTWLGDDDDSELVRWLGEELAALTQAGVDLFLMRGNRDFLLGEAFASRCGATLLDDPVVINLYDTDVLLMHGDSLCTADTEYMAFRSQIRDPEKIAQLLAQPLKERRALAKQLRSQSKSANASKAKDIMDVTADEVVRVMEDHEVDTLIHGHTHRPAEHSLHLANGEAHRIVLGDWDKSGWVLEAKPEAAGAALTLESFAL